VQALRSLQSDARLLYRGLFPEKKNPDGTTVRRKDGITPVTYTAAEMVLMASPQMESKKQVYSRSITVFANEPCLDATRLQRTAVTAGMKQGMDHRAGSWRVERHQPRAALWRPRRRQAARRSLLQQGHRAL
jgi:hypothetical protein